MNKLVLCIVMLICNGINVLPVVASNCVSTPWDPRSCDHAGKEEAPGSEQDAQITEVD